MQTLTYMAPFASWAAGFLYRGGVNFRKSEPDHWSAKGRNCDDICMNIYEGFMSYSEVTLLYARCTYDNLGNKEKVADTPTDTSSMITNIGNSRTEFLAACTGLFSASFFFHSIFHSIFIPSIFHSCCFLLIYLLRIFMCIPMRGYIVECY